MAKKEIPGTSILKAEPITAEIQTFHQPTPMDLISMAISKDMDIAKLEKLMELQQKWKAQIALEEFNLAFSKFQSIVPDMSKNRNVNYHPKGDTSRRAVNYNYQDLGDIGKNIKGALSECGLSYNWETEEIGDDISVFAILKHSGGHELRGKALKAKADGSGGKEGLHAKGSTITFLKRYTLTAILGLTTSEPDDDGHAALKSQKQDNPDLSVGDDACPMIKDEEFKTTMKKVMGGDMTVDHVLKNRRLTTAEHTALVTAEKAAVAKKGTA